MECFYCKETIKKSDTYWIIYEDCEPKSITMNELENEIEIKGSYDVHGLINLQCGRCYDKK